MRGDTRRRATAGSRSSIAVVAETVPPRPLPAVPYPVIVSEARTASRQALVSYAATGIRCHRSLPPPM
ncbi:hypothetical protein ACVWWN_005155 [Mycobacterium sp. URHB0021]|jgi:hypothetical protein